MPTGDNNRIKTRCPRGHEYNRTYEYRGKITRYCTICSTRSKREYVERNREARRAYEQEYEQRPEVKARRRDSHLRRKFGITLEDYLALYAQQDGLCAACGREHTPTAQHPELVVDHCHSTQAIRGLLCVSCNTAAGHVGDDPERLRQIADYLERAAVPTDL